MVLTAFHFSNQKAKVREMEHTVNVIPVYLVYQDYRLDCQAWAPTTFCGY